MCLWRCWPRTLVLEGNPRYRINVPMFETQSDEWTTNPADEVQRYLGKVWYSWWNPRSCVNVCVVTLKTSSKSRQFLYASTSHKYSDGGAAAALLHALSEAYESRISNG